MADSHVPPVWRETPPGWVPTLTSCLAFPVGAGWMDAIHPPPRVGLGAVGEGPAAEQNGFAEPVEEEPAGIDPPEQVAALPAPVVVAPVEARWAGRGRGLRGNATRYRVDRAELGQDVVQEIDRLRAAMDLAIQAQGAPAGRNQPWLAEEVRLLLALRRHGFGYQQIRQEYMPRRTHPALVIRHSDEMKRRAE